MRLEREMTRVQEMHLGVRQVATVRDGTFRWEDEVVLAPHDQRRRLILPEEGLELRVHGHIRPVVVEQVHLDLSIPRAIKTDLVQEVKGCSVLRPWIGPVFLEGVPELAKALVVGVAVLYDERLYLIGTAQREPVSNRRAVVHHVERKSVETESLDERVDNVGQILERIRKAPTIRRAALAEARIVGRDEAEGAGEARDQVPKHVGRRREPV